MTDDSLISQTLRKRQRHDGRTDRPDPSLFAQQHPQKQTNKIIIILLLLLLLYSIIIFIERIDRSYHSD
jgi:hypothetical protein